MYKRTTSILCGVLALACCAMAVAAQMDPVLGVASMLSAPVLGAGVMLAAAAAVPLAESAAVASTTMRAKFVVGSVEPFGSGERLKFIAVPKSTAYPEDGADEDNTFAKFSPQASCEITVMNPNLMGKFQPGQRFYVDFTPATS